MKHLIIIGAGGMGRCLYSLAMESKGYKEEFDVKGFIDDNLNALDGFANYPAVINTISNYQPVDDDVFVCSIGDVATKIKVCNELESRGATFQTLIHNKASIGMNTVIGQGSIVDEDAHIDPDVIIGKNCMIQVQAIIGHDSIIGDNVRIDSQAFMVGGIKVGSGTCIYTKAMINHNVEIGENAVVGACSFVIKNVKPGTTVFGSPAKPIF